MNNYIIRIAAEHWIKFEDYAAKENIKFKIIQEPFDVLYIVSMNERAATALKLTIPIKGMMNYKETV